MKWCKGWFPFPRGVKANRSAEGDRSGGAGQHAAAAEIREVTSRRDLSKFVKLPWTIYAGDSQWVPPLLIDVKEFLDRKSHPFYLHGE
ncbi:MAG: hypothetical protein ACYTG0_30715, partial [Planctomycetota bacterium]